MSNGTIFNGFNFISLFKILTLVSKELFSSFLAVSSSSCMGVRYSDKDISGMLPSWFGIPGFKS